MVDNAERVLDWCRRFSYSAWYLRDHARLDQATTLADRGRCHLLLQPADWPYPDWLQGIPQSAPLASTPAG